MSDQNLAAALAEARQTLAHKGTGYVPAWNALTDAEREASIVEAGHWLTALARVTEARVESGSRVTIDGYVAYEGKANADLAQARVRHHADQRARQPDWRGNAEELQRTVYVTPWEVVASPTVGDGPFADPVAPCATCGCAKSWHYKERGGYCVGDFMHCECREYVEVKTRV
jgi:hypothetical protein